MNDTQAAANENKEAVNYADEYINAFGNIETPYPKESRLAKAYETALDIRKFEITLYWQRSNSFWLVVGGIAAALGLLLSGKADSATNEMLTPAAKEVICCCLSLAGATIAYAWSLVNKGSKFWQRNWEYQVDVLESAVLGPLYRTVFAEPDTRAMHSVSEINVWISRYICLIFSVATVAFATGQHGKAWLADAIRHVWASADIPFVFKGAVVLANLIAIGCVRYAVTSHRKKSGTKTFDVEAEVSIRAIDVVNTHGSAKARAQWNHKNGSGNAQPAQSTPPTTAASS